MSDILKSITDRWHPPAEGHPFDHHQRLTKRFLSARATQLAEIPADMQIVLGLDEPEETSVKDEPDAVDLFLEKVRLDSFGTGTPAADITFSQMMSDLLDPLDHVDRIHLPLNKRGKDKTIGKRLEDALQQAPHTAAGIAAVLEEFRPHCLEDEIELLEAAVARGDVRDFTELAVTIPMRVGG